ncbi:hypothetical protein KIN20_008340 [Parelaphostrongylus tenuis]|uniref:Suppressor APC domain-containing protein n=1 Tax=Parelaphostrongylus tenuis TaxID=148309 RepID=A0AAD5M4Q1_PARTN|nr:hypothetical protein KIN20_008340 [Parelaphostrongylus tenuis]
MRYENISPDLHPEFIESLRILFDILDTTRSGKVRYETLCERFGELHHPQLPPTFLTCVGKVAPVDGLISFERFLAAVKLSLRNTIEINNNTIYRAQSEGRLTQNFDKRRIQAPAMGIKGLDRRPVICGSYSAINEPNNFRAQSAEKMNAARDTPTSNLSQLYLPTCNCSFDVEQHVTMRSKKVNTVRSQKEESRMRHAVPPSSALPRVAANRGRPQSMLSHNSLASSGLDNVAWRNSSFSTSTTDSHRRLTISDDDTAQRVRKLEGLLKEELELVQKGMEMAQKLCEWYRARLMSLDKRKRLLGQGLVALETAVHEQKLNFLRAHVTELSRRIVSLMESSERGFPSHANLQKSSLPQPHDDQLVWLHRQNLMLNQELLDKTQMLEELRKEKENAANCVDRCINMEHLQPTRAVVSQERPSAFVRPAFHYQPIKHVTASLVGTYDTLM